MMLWPSKDHINDPSIGSKDKPSMDTNGPRRIPSFEVYVDPSNGSCSKDDPSKSSFELTLYPSTKTCCLGINTHVLASFEADL